MGPRSHNRIVALGACAIAGRRYGIERAIRAVARLQHGVITRAQLLAIGLTANGISSRVKRGQLRVLHLGVYLVGPVKATRADQIAAVLAAGDGSCLGHESAAHIYGLPAKPDTIHVIAPRLVRRPGIAVHRTRIEADEIADYDGVPTTTPTRTILDLAAKLPSDALEHLLAQAYAANLTSRHKLLKIIARYPGRPGTPALQELLDARPALTRSPPERRLLGLIRRAKLPEPRTNARLHGWEVDFLWPERRLVVEVDALWTDPIPQRQAGGG
jgi:hypothetical protein